MNPDPQDLLRLADEVAAATGPDRRLDAVIWLHLPAQEPHAWKHNGDKVKHAHRIAGCTFIPAYTASLDAAMTLVPEGYGFQVDGFGDHWWASLSEDEGFNARALKPALALCAAALKARAHSTKESDNG